MLTRLLFVDDDALTLNLMAKIATLLGYQPIICHSPREGVLMAAREKPTMIFVDMQMSEMNGIEFVRQIRCVPELSEMPVLICSAEQSNDYENMARNVGATAYLTKPLGPDEMQQVVKSYSNGKIDA